MYIDSSITALGIILYFLLAALASIRGGGGWGAWWIVFGGFLKEINFVLKDLKTVSAMKIRLTRTVEPMMKTKARACWSRN
jgi:hypothetical protein